MRNDNGVLVGPGHSLDEILAILPQCEVFTVTLITVNGDVLFTGIRVDED